MKFTVDKKKAFELLDWHKNLIKNDIPSDIFESDMKRRAIYCLCTPMKKKVHSCRQSFCAALKAVGVKEVPGDLEALTEFIGSRSDLGLEQSSNLDGCSLECDSIPIHKVTFATLCLVKSYLKKDGEDFVRDQVKWIFSEKIKGCLLRMHSEWDTKLSLRNLNLPLEDETFVKLVLSQSDYKDRLERDKESSELTTGNKNE